jgi:hypothetical protein
MSYTSVPTALESVPTKVSISVIAVFSFWWSVEWDGLLSLSVGCGFARELRVLG